MFLFQCNDHFSVLISDHFPLFLFFSNMIMIMFLFQCIDYFYFSIMIISLAVLHFSDYFPFSAQR